MYLKVWDWVVEMFYFIIAIGFERGTRIKSRQRVMSNSAVSTLIQLNQVNYKQRRMAIIFAIYHFGVVWQSLLLFSILGKTFLYSYDGIRLILPNVYPLRHPATYGSHGSTWTLQARRRLRRRIRVLRARWFLWNIFLWHAEVVSITLP